MLRTDMQEFLHSYLYHNFETNNELYTTNDFHM